MNDTPDNSTSAMHPSAAVNPSLGTAPPAPQPQTAGLDWYKDAVIYQLHVRSFQDSTGDGIGDFPGLTSRLDYVASLGATAIWLMPFYPSPLRDEGYDIADYMNVNPMYGTLDQFRTFLAAAHERGLRVITELIINHTSDQHAWFQSARRAPAGSPERDFYVWSDTPDRYAGVRVIFQDFEPSNWSWDPVAEQYFWHRFYSHQPDLNFDNPAVQQAVLDVVDFWLEMGVDGLRLDAIPYLFEREGTTCESLPETHAFLRKLRAHIDQHFPGRMLLAEANQWPDETAAYFGAGDECQMCFHFPLMPRLFLAVQQEERFPIVDILMQTPLPPALAQWAIFLRNHDELTLEMVSEDERDTMYRAFASDPQARVNVGLRRRLAPLLRNDRRKLELMHGLLFSLPGTPVLYYGDEIRMGDNIYLRDRDSVRTPMQWSPDRNGGFSQANPQRMFLPPITDPAYHYQSLNVETEEQSPHSLLWWLRRVVHLRQQHVAFGRGGLEFLFPDSPHLLAFLRQYEGVTILVVANLSRLTQFVELDLSRFRGRTPVELFGQTRFPTIGDLPYMLTMGPYGFYWFTLESPHGEHSRLDLADLPALSVHERWDEVFRGRAAGALKNALAAYVDRQQWHVSAQRTIRALEVIDVIPLPEADEDGSHYLMALVRADYTDGEPAWYQLAVIATGAERARAILHDRPVAGIARVEMAGKPPYILCDATAERDLWRRLANQLPTGQSLAGRVGKVEFHPTPALVARGPLSSSDISPIWRRIQGRAAVAAIDKQIFLKLIRRVEAGPHPEPEIGAALAPLTTLPVPRLCGSWKYEHPVIGSMLLGVAIEYAPHEQTLGDFCHEDLQRLLETVSSDPARIPPMAATATSDGTTGEVAPGAAEPFASPARWMARIGRRLAEVHRALADLPGEAFVPEPFTTHYRRSVVQAFRSQAVRSLALLREQLGQPALAHVRERGLVLVERMSEIDQLFRPIERFQSPMLRIRCHNDLTLEHILLTGDDLRLIDWEGDPTRPLSSRRIKRSVLRDIARLGQSLALAAALGAAHWQKQFGAGKEVAARSELWAVAWQQACMASLLGSYRQGIHGTRLAPVDEAEFAATLGAYRLNAAMEELLNCIERERHELLSGVLTTLERQLP